jgi:diadenosine tetraphosphatase ApaH/serine/threonine PP2A family protein phosphatase
MSVSSASPSPSVPLASGILAGFRELLDGTDDPIEAIGRTQPLPIFPSVVLRSLCEAAAALFRSQAVVLRLCSPICVVGDIHGSIHDLIRILRTIGNDMPYLFLGDYVDRGSFSTEVVTLLFALAVNYPDRYFLIRGNHECSDVTETYGFKDEVLLHSSLSTYDAFMEAFSWLPLAAIVDSVMFCVHGGIGPNVNTIRQIEEIQRPIAESRSVQIVCELLWSDPNDALMGFGEGGRIGRPQYGKRAVKQFLEDNGLKYILRGHQCVDGVLSARGMPVATVFSSSSYKGSGSNRSGIVKLSDGGNVDVVLFDPIAPLSRREADFFKSVRAPAGEIAPPMTFSLTKSRGSPLVGPIGQMPIQLVGSIKVPNPIGPAGMAPKGLVGFQWFVGSRRRSGGSAPDFFRNMKRQD